MHSKKRRMNLFIPLDINEKLEKWAAKLELPKSTLINLSVRAGLDAIIRAIEPAEAFEPAKWAEIIKAVKPEDLNIEAEKATNKAG